MQVLSSVSSEQTFDHFDADLGVNLRSKMMNFACIVGCICLFGVSLFTDPDWGLQKEKKSLKSIKISKMLKLTEIGRDAPIKGVVGASAPPTSGPHHPPTTDFSRQTRFRMPLTQFGQLFFPKISRKRPSSSSSVNDLSFIYSRLGQGWRKYLCI